MANKPSDSQPPGPGVDAQGRAVVDPTQNVSDLVTAAIERQDDIRNAWQVSIQRELTLRQEMRERDHASLKQIIETRIDAIDRATELLSSTVNRTPTEITKEIGHLSGIVDERLASVESRFVEADRLTSTQFKERDTRTEREARDNKLAVDAAFAAQEKQAVAQNEGNQLAINKSEQATAETIKTNQELSRSEINALRKQAEDREQRQREVDEDMKKRLGAIEAALTGIASSSKTVTDTKVDSRAGNAQLVAVIGAFLVALALGVSVASLFMGR